jgi:D-lactate dehydrogenase
MTKIIDYQPDNRLVRVQPGVINATLQQLVAQKGFFWPPDPSSAATCTIGGNLAYNSAGPRAVKYGTPRENTLGLTIITGTGELLQTGCRTTKGVVGYDLTRLIIGSEGTLGIITEATLKLLPSPPSIATLQFWFDSIEQATHSIVQVMCQPTLPCAVEWMDTRSVALIRDHTDLPVPETAKALLMVEVDGEADELESLVTKIKNCAQNKGCLKTEQAFSDADKQRLWSARKSLSPLLRKIAPKKINEDVVVPIANLPSLINALEKLSDESGIPIVNFGHAGNGNIHVNLLVDPDDAAQMRHIEPTLSKVFDHVLKLDGTLSGEHGIGIEKKPYIKKELSPTYLSIMRGIKKVFDPKGIMNPNKIFDLE